MTAESILFSQILIHIYARTLFLLFRTPFLAFLRQFCHFGWANAGKVVSLWHDVTAGAMKQEVKKYFSQFPKYFSGFHVYCGARNADLQNGWKSSLAIVGDTGISSVISINQ